MIYSTERSFIGKHFIRYVISYFLCCVVDLIMGIAIGAHLYPPAQAKAKWMNPIAFQVAQWQHD